LKLKSIKVNVSYCKKTHKLLIFIDNGFVKVSKSYEKYYEFAKEVSLIPTQLLSQLPKYPNKNCA